MYCLEALDAAKYWLWNGGFEAGGLFIEKQITFDEDGHAVGDELKTEESEGYIPMPKWYMDSLKKYHHEKKNCYVKNGSVDQSSMCFIQARVRCITLTRPH